MTSGQQNDRSVRAKLVFDAEHYARLMLDAVAKAKVSVWIATANIKGMMIEAPVGSVARARRDYISILDTLASLHARGVELRMLHASAPSRAFRHELRSKPALSGGGLQMRMCPRVHAKIIAVDGALLYLGSANFTGAGLGAKGAGRRNFEVGMITDDDVWLDAAQEYFDRIWTGGQCKGCRMRRLCPGPLDRLS